MPFGFSSAWCKSMVPAIVASFAFVTGYLFSFQCRSIQFPPIDGLANASPVQFGPWYALASGTKPGPGDYVIATNTCVSYSTYADPKLKTVRAFGIIAAIIGGLLTFALWLAPCLYVFTDSTWRCVALTFMLFVTLCQGLTFLLYNSSFCLDNPLLKSLGVAHLYSSECQWDEGSSTNAASVVLYFLTGVCMLVIGAPKRPVQGPAETQTVTYQKTTNPDGTSTVAEVAVVKGVAVPNPQKQEVTEEVPAKEDTV